MRGSGSRRMKPTGRERESKGELREVFFATLPFFYGFLKPFFSLRESKGGFFQVDEEI